MHDLRNKMPDLSFQNVLCYLSPLELANPFKKVGVSCDYKGKLSW